MRALASSHVLRLFYVLDYGVICLDKVETGRSAENFSFTKRRSNYLLMAHSAWSREDW